MATTAAAQAAQPAGPAPAPTFTIARNPGGAIAGPLNLATDKVHITFYNGAIKGLEPRYNGDPKHLLAFLASVSAHSKVYNWASILSYNNQDFFKHYGTIRVSDMKTQALIYSGANVTRESQDSAMMALFIQNSIDTDLFSRLLNISSDFTVNNLPDGPLMLKAIISLVQLATNGDAMVLALQEQLQNLRLKVKTYDSIVDFNAYVRETIQTLENYGVRPDETTIKSYLFGAYLEVEDNTFHEVIRRIHADSRLGLGTNRDYHAIMRLAEEQYKIQFTEKTWKTPSKTEAQLIALKASLEANKKKNAKTDPTSTTSDKSADKSWRKTPPARGQKHTIKRDDKTYHWCGTHKAWTAHKGSECKLKLTEQEGKDKGKSPTPTTNPTPTTPAATPKVDDAKKTKKERYIAKLAELLVESDSE